MSKDKGFPSIKDNFGQSLTPHLDAVKLRRTDPALTPPSTKTGDCTGVRGRKG